MVKHISILLIMIFAFSFAHGAENFKPAPVISLSQSEVWQRQQVILTLAIPTPDEFARLEVEEFDLSNFEVVALPFDRSPNRDAQPQSANQYTVKVAWILFPLVAGQYDIELPQIYYRPNSGRKIKLKIPLQKLSVKSLPSYIPATMPVGEVMINNSMSPEKPGGIYNTQTLLNWNIELITKNVLPQTIPPILRQVKSSEALDVFPETLDKKVIKTYKGLQNDLRYQVPIKALKSGKLDLPALSIQYFDPEDAKLKRAKSKPLNYWAVNYYLQWFIFMIIIVGLLFVLLKFFQVSRQYFSARQKIRLAVQKINQAENIQQLRAALHDISRAKGWGDNVTLQQLPKSWKKQVGDNIQLQSSLESLQTEQFSGEKSKSLETLKKELISNLKGI